MSDATLTGVLAWRFARELIGDSHDALGMVNAWGAWLESAGLIAGAVTIGVRGHRASALGLAGVASLRTLRAAEWRPKWPLAALHETARPRGTLLRVWSCNLLYRQSATDRLLAALAQWAPDLILLQELTPTVTALLAPALVDTYPHQLLDPDPGPDGFGIFARMPLSGSAVRTLPGGNRHVQVAHLHLDGRRVALFNCHLVSPSDGGAIRRLGMGGVARLRQRQAEDVADLVKGATHQQGVHCTLIGGDFNASPSQVPVAIMRRVATDTWGAAGVGGGTTWPRQLFVNPLATPPLLRLDYVFATPGLAPLRARVERTALGSDHCPLIVDFA